MVSCVIHETTVECDNKFASVDKNFRSVTFLELWFAFFLASALCFINILFVVLSGLKQC